MTRPPPKPDAPLYETIADRIEEMVNRGIFEPGERLPSIRQLHADYAVSINTIREAFSLLEARGVAEPRAQSGHFVRRGPLVCEGDEMDFPDVEAALPRDVSAPSLTRQVLLDGRRDGWVDLAAVEPSPDLLPTERLAELTARRLRRDAASVSRYAYPPGLPELRQEIAKRIVRSGVTVGADQIVVTAGCLEAVFLTLMTICERGDAVLIESPGFFLFYQLLQQLGLRAIELPCRPSVGVDPRDVERVLARHGGGSRIRAALFVPAYANPIGACVPDENKEAIAEILSRFDVTLIEDDIYGEMSWEGSRPRSMASFVASGRAVLCASFSKTIAPGYRVGWLAGSEGIVRRVQHNKLLTSIAVSSPAAAGITEYLVQGGFDRWLRVARRKYRDAFAAIRATIHESFPAGTRSTRPEGGMVIWVALPPGTDTVELYNRCRGEHIVFAPGPIFSLDGSYRNCLRITATRYNDDVAAAVRRIGALSAT